MVARVNVPALSILQLADAWGMHDGDVGTGWMIAMMVGMAIFWGLVIVGVVWLLREVIGRNRPSSNPLEILDRRLAEGEVSVEEYDQRRKALADRRPTGDR